MFYITEQISTDKFLNYIPNKVITVSVSPSRLPQIERHYDQLIGRILDVFMFRERERKFKLACQAYLADKHIQMQDINLLCLQVSLWI